MQLVEKRVIFSERESQALVEFMHQMDREYMIPTVFPVSPQDRLYWRLGGEGALDNDDDGA